MDVPIHTLRYFCVLAEELHFGRAAARLSISSPSLSQQISRLETVVGEPLFSRTSRAVSLTSPGNAMLPHARRAVEAHAGVVDWIAARQADSDTVLRVGVVAAGAGPLTTAALTAAMEQHPALRLEMRKVGFFDADAELLAGRVDAVFAPAPLSLADGSIVGIPLWSEPRVLVVEATHRFAGRDSIGIDETNGETFISVSGGDPVTVAWWLVDPRPDGSHPRVGALAQDIDGILELCAAGVGVNIAAASAASHYRRSELAFIPIVDIEPATVLLCTRAHREPAVAAFVRIVEAEAEKVAPRSVDAHGDRLPV